MCTMRVFSGCSGISGGVCPCVRQAGEKGAIKGTGSGVLLQVIVLNLQVVTSSFGKYTSIIAPFN